MFFFKQKTAYEMRISDWSSDVCSSDLHCIPAAPQAGAVYAPRYGHALTACPAPYPATWPPQAGHSPMNKPMPVAHKTTVPLYRLAHSRTGDKGDISNNRVIAWKPALFPILKEPLNEEALKKRFETRRAAMREQVGK